MEDFATKLKSFVEGCQQIINKQFATCYDNLTPPTLVIDPKGRKFVRIVKKETSYGGGSVHCFVDRSNGDVLKAAGWKAPAKHARGNIFDEHNGLAKMLWTGPEYLR